MNNNGNFKFNNTFDYKLIYIFRINDKEHSGYLKIGDATITTNKSPEELFNNCKELNYSAKKRIDSYTSTAGIVYELLHTEIAVRIDKNKGNLIKGFRDHNVHTVLLRSGIEKKQFDTNRKQNEWFKTDLETAKKAINAVKDCKASLTSNEVTTYMSPIIFRPEQKEAIEKALKVFKTSNEMLWNAKMRFGKTLSTLEVVKKSEYKKTIIITHRPVVSDSWFDDFNKIFYDKKNYKYSSKDKGESLNNLLKSDNSFVYFASIQDLRGSKEIGGNHDKNQNVFATHWDLIVIDEAHEGTQTNLGKQVVNGLINNKENHTTKILKLSGTPFNILSDFKESDIYTWDYIAEQEAKTNWCLNNFGDSNPYEELPKMNIFTYHLEKEISGFIETEDKAFNFKEFFRTFTGIKEKDFANIPNGQTIGDFVHKDKINALLNLLCKESNNSNYPFSTEEYRNLFKHTLWMLPGVREAKALSSLLKEHHVFCNFTIVNVAGDGDEEDTSEDSLVKVRNAISKDPDNTYTITLSCGRLTTGVSIPEWTAVLMFAGSYSTAASQYLQTIFRVQTPANINGRFKENAYVFDFAPDRTLKMVAESVQLSSKTSGAAMIDSQAQLNKFLNFCPVIAIEQSNMKEFKVNELLQQLKKAYAERVAKNGFDDIRLYNDELLKLDNVALEEFEKLKRIVGENKQKSGGKDAVINDEGFTNEEYEQTKKLEKKPKSQLTEEDKKRLEELKEKKKNKNTAISILRAISIRIPLLVYGMDKDIDVDFNVEDFAKKDLFDDASWDEFMPKGVTRDVFIKFSKYYDKDIFVAASRRIRAVSKNADNLDPIERIKELTKLFSTFKNPDKETVLTPWRVVNMHMGNSIGGYNFFDETFNIELDEPRYIEKDNTNDIFNTTPTKLLEINSKSGMYPLYLTFTLYQKLVEKEDKQLSIDEKNIIWDKVLTENIYVICKTQMARQITKRTLCGFRNVKLNTHAFNDLVMQLKEKEEKFISQVKSENFWSKKGSGEVKFNAIVGNPPYQGTNHQQIYPNFYASSIQLGEHVSLIFPVGWQKPKNANNLSKLNNEIIKADKQIIFIDNRQNVFPEVSGAEWVNIIMWKKGYDNKLDGMQKILTNGENETIQKLLWVEDLEQKPSQILELNKIIQKIEGFKSIQTVTSSRKPYGLETNLFTNEKDINFTKLSNEKLNDTDIKIYGNKFTFRYVQDDFSSPKVSKSFNKYKIFITYAWGNMDEKSGLGGAFSNIIIGKPTNICTETYLESGSFDSYEESTKHAKYMMTQFFRALLYVNKTSQHSTGKFGAIPLQDYKEKWWSESIAVINEKLFEKYNIPKEIYEFVKNNIQLKDESNIITFED